MFVKYKELLLNQKEKTKQHKYRANLKGKNFPQLYLEFVLDVSENQGRIGKHLAIFMCVRARVSILDPVFLRPDPKWRSKLEQKVTDGAILTCACATMFHWNLPWCGGFYCLLWRISARHKDFIDRICKTILTFYEESLQL